MGIESLKAGRAPNVHTFFVPVQCRLSLRRFAELGFGTRQRPVVLQSGGCQLQNKQATCGLQRPGGASNSFGPAQLLVKGADLRPKLSVINARRIHALAQGSLGLYEGPAQPPLAPQVHSLLRNSERLAQSRHCI
jgi:hypothetical protein